MASMVLRALTAQDIDACARIVVDRGWTTPRAHWPMLLRFGSGVGIEMGGELCGTVIRFPHEGVSSVGMLLVRKNVEGHGFGRQLLEAVLKQCDAAALYATPLGAPLYEKTGFTVRDHVVMYAGNVEPSACPDVLVRTMSAVPAREREAIVASDVRACGYARRALLAGMFEHASEIATIERDGRLSYAMAWRHRGSTHIGPVVADDDATAVTLVRALAQESREYSVHVPRGHPAFRAQLQDLGLREIKELPLMTRGNVPLPGRALYATALMATG